MSDTSEVKYGLIVDQTGVVRGAVFSNLLSGNAIEVSEGTYNQAVLSLGSIRWDGDVLIDIPQPDPVPTVPADVSDRQFFEALANRGEITEDEALEAVGPGIIPARMLALIEQLPADSQFGAKMLIRGATTFERDNPLAGLIGTLFGWDAEALDEFWTFAATL